ncbi:MAG: GIY-YIG nuclease family protein [Candidatus Brocadiaceae bacterium]|nr:GIY-YIG nuclease family protein [Candidatus Brocadiaceae bacterium]
MNKGIYCLTIKLLKKHNIRVGCLGTFRFPRGFYVYVGSAQNNLEDRIERHLRQDKKMHWHIDYLLHYGQVTCVHTYAGEKHTECMLSQKIRNIKNVQILVNGFGSSDCSCTSHLYFFQDNPDFRISRLRIIEAKPQTKKRLKPQIPQITHKNLTHL